MYKFNISCPPVLYVFNRNCSVFFLTEFMDFVLYLSYISMEFLLNCFGFSICPGFMIRKGVVQCLQFQLLQVFLSRFV